MKKIVTLIDEVEKKLIVYPFLILGVFIVYEIVARKTIGKGLSWLQELGRYIMVYGTFLGSSIAIKKRAHPSMVSVIHLLSNKTKNIVNAVGNSLCGICFIVVSYFSWLHLYKLIKLGTMTSSLGIPLFIPYMCLPICFSVMTIRFFIQCYIYIKGIKTEGKIK